MVATPAPSAHTDSLQRVRAAGGGRRELLAVSPFVAVLFVLPLVPTTGLATQTVAVTQIPRGVSCPECQIELERLVTLDAGREDPGVIGMIPLAAQGLTGRWYAAASEGVQQVGVFDDRGELVQLLGRQGDGPGEFQGIRFLTVDLDGALHVYGPNRRSIFAADHSFAASHPTPAPFVREAANLPDGRAVIQARIATPDAAGYPLHLLSATGALERSFGTDQPVYPEPPGSLSRAIAVDRHGRIWSAHGYEHRLDVFGPQGEPLATYAREAPEWWGSPQSGDPSVVLRVAFDPADPTLLWITSRVQDPEWDPRMLEEEIRRGGGVGVRPDQGRNDRQFDIVVEAFDTETGRIVAMTRFDEYYFRGRPHLFTRLEVLEDDFVVVLHVFEPRLVRPSAEDHR